MHMHEKSPYYRIVCMCTVEKIFKLIKNCTILYKCTGNFDFIRYQLGLYGATCIQNSFLGKT